MQLGKQVGIYDADIYGPSLPVLISPKDRELKTFTDNPNMIIPIEYNGIKVS